MYLFYLNMSNIKSKALAQECSKRKVFFKTSAELTGKQLCAGASYIIKMQTAWIKSNSYVHIAPGAGVFQRNLRNFYENLLEHEQICRTFANKRSL